MNLDHYKSKNYSFQNVMKASNQPNFNALSEIKAFHLRDMAESFDNLLTDAILLHDEVEKLKKQIAGKAPEIIYHPI